MEATAEKYAELFNTMGIISDAGVMAYRTKTIKSGKMLEAELFPIYAGRAECIRLKEQKKKISAEVMQEANERNSWKRMNRLTHANFGEGDFWCTLTYAEGQSVTREQAKRDMRNFIERVQREREKQGLGKTKYIYVIEWGETNGRIHHHIIMEKMDWESVHKLWKMGRTEVQRLQEDDKGGYKAMTRYMLKRLRPNGEGLRRKEKAWAASKGMKKPVEFVSDRKVSRRRVERIAKAMIGEEAEARAIFEKTYPGYRMESVSVKICEWAPGAYIYCTMFQEERNGAGRSTGAGGIIPVGGIRAGEMAGAGGDVSHTKRREQKQGGGGKAQGAGRKGRGA